VDPLHPLPPVGRSGAAVRGGSRAQPHGRILSATNNWPPPDTMRKFTWKNRRRCSFYWKRQAPHLAPPRLRVLLNGRRISSQNCRTAPSPFRPTRCCAPWAGFMLPRPPRFWELPKGILCAIRSDLPWAAGRMPVAVPRAGFTILDAHSQNCWNATDSHSPIFSKAKKLSASEWLRPGSPGLTGTMRDTAGAVERAVEHLRAELAAFDPTLAQALDRSGRKIRYRSQSGKQSGPRSHAPRCRATEDAASLSV